MIRHPSLPVAGVFCQQRQFSRLQVQAIWVECFGVSSVHADDYLIGHLLEVVDDGRAHTLEGCVWAQVRAVDVDAIELVVLVAAGILHEQDALVVRPEVASNTAGSFIRQLSRAIAFTHEDIHSILVGS